MALVMSRSFESLANTFVLAAWPFYALSVAAIFRPMDAHHLESCGLFRDEIRLSSV